MAETTIKYAPVLIPTLNRYQHFKECLESIERCTWAEHTDVYVALDYPPSDKYVEGWRMIDAYLKEKERTNGFHQLIVFRRDHNCGIGKEGSNINLLTTYVRGFADRYILTEDDNVFSSNALVYFDRLLDKYETDDRITRITGYNYDNTYPEDFEGNYYLAQTVYPWVNAIWTNKNRDRLQYSNLDYLRQLVRNAETRRVLKAKRPEALAAIVSMIKRNQLYGDTIEECYMMLNDKYYILPRVSKVRNIGNDGTGVHCPKKSEHDDYFSNQSTDTGMDFIPSEAERILEATDVKRMYDISDYSLRGRLKRIISQMDLFLLIHFNYVPKSKYI